MFKKYAAAIIILFTSVSFLSAETRSMTVGGRNLSFYVADSDNDSIALSRAQRNLAKAERIILNKTVLNSKDKKHLSKYLLNARYFLKGDVKVKKSVKPCSQKVKDSQKYVYLVKKLHVIESYLRG